MPKYKSPYERDIDTMREGASLAERLLKARQEPNDDEVRTIASALDATERVKAARAEMRADQELRKRLGDAFREQDGLRSSTGGKSGRFSAKCAAGATFKQINQGRLGQKAIAPSGATVAPAGLTDPIPVPLGRPVVRNLLSVIEAKVVDQPPTVAYLRQTQRVNNAAPVASGAEKPVSVYGLERVEDRLRVIAHLSEPLDRFWLEDSADLEQFITDELTYGLDVAIEQQLINGSGVGENSRGLLQTSGIQTQPWSVDGHETVRRAITLAQAAGGAESVVVALNPVDWQNVSLTRSTTGEFLTTDATSVNYPQGAVGSPPVGSPLLLSWGAPVVLSNAVPVGTGVVFDPTAVTLYVDGNVRTEWNSSEGFSTNTIRARTETRALVAVRRPLGVVSVDMTAA